METCPGLTSSQVKSQTQKYGPNTVKENKISLLKIILNQILNPLIYLLILATVISLLTQAISDAIIITVIILINTILGTFQEYKSNKALAKLTSFISSKVTVIRNNKKQVIDKIDLVPGDLIIHQLGDIVAADAYVLEEKNLLIDESSISGESESVSKESISKDICAQITKSLDFKNLININKSQILYSGTAIVKGTVTAIVFATGKNSKFGKIADLSLNTKRISEYEENIKTLSKWFTVISILSLAIIIGLHLFIDKNPNYISLVLFTLAIAITIIPEALPVVSTLTLSIGAERLAKKQVIVKRIAAIEDLGNIDILCSDKTGTLTLNKLEVRKYLAEDQNELIKYSHLLTEKSTDPIDIAIFSEISKTINHKLSTINLNFQDLPFDPKLRYSARKFDDFTIYKGSPENIIKSFAKDKTKDLDEIKNISANQGFRAISIAYENKDEKQYLGTYFFEDEVKLEAKEAIGLGLKRNIFFKMITGDSLEVAVHVGKTVALIESEADAIDASDLHFNDKEKLFEEVNKYKIFARADPVQKYEIIKSLLTKYHVGYIGDGINDAPALKLATVGMVVDSASDIAKASADIILLNKNLDVIMNGIIEGRKVFNNIDKYLKHTLSANFGNLYTIGLISFLINFLPLLPIQILMNNLLSDIPCLAISTDKVDIAETRHPKHHTTKDLIQFSLFLGIISSIFDIIFFLWAKNFPEAYFQSLLFIFATLTELFVIFSMRTKKLFIRGKRPSKYLSYSASISIIITVLIAIFGLDILNIIPINILDLSIIIFITIIFFIVSEATKLLYYHLTNNITSPVIRNS
jgi:Mg2+-importing ATPase